MKKILTTILMLFTIIHLSNAQTITPVEAAEFCPLQEIVFTVTVIGTNPTIVSGTNSPILIQGVYNENYNYTTGITTFNFKGKFQDVNVAQTFMLRYQSGGYIEKPFIFKNIKSLFFQNSISSNCPGIQLGQTAITAPMCKESNIPFNFLPIMWNTFGENPDYCFGTIATYEYQLPAGWKLNGTTSTGNNWIGGSYNVTLTSDQSTGGVIRVKPSNNCGANLQNGQPFVEKAISRPQSFTVTSSPASITCGSSTPITFTINDVFGGSGITNYSWNLGATPNGWLLPNGNPAPQTYSTGLTNTLILTPDCGAALSSVSATVTANGNSCNTNASVVSITIPYYSIVGVNVLCSGSQTYSVNNLPCNAVVSNWVATPGGIVTITPSGNSATVMKSSGNGNVTISATVNSCGTTNTANSGTIAVGVPDNNFSLSIYSASNTVCPGLPMPFVALYPNRCDLLDAEWEVDPADANINYNQGFPCEISNNNTGATISFSSYGTYAVRVKVQNSCGWSGWSQPKYIEVSCGYSFIVSPNPASNTVTVQSDQKTNATITQLSVFDNNGNLKKQSKFGTGTRQAQMNIYDLKTGIYFIEISSGNKKERQQLIIQK